MNHQVCPTCGSARTSTEAELWKTKDCNCYQQSQLATLYKNAGIPNIKPDEYWYYNLKTDWKRSKDCREIKMANKYIAYLDNAVKNNIWLMFNGQVGQWTGKTFLAIEILKQALKKGYQGKYFDFPSLTAEDQIFGRMPDYDLIVIDQIDPYSTIGKQNTLNFLQRFLQYRHKPVILIVEPGIELNKPLANIINKQRRRMVEVNFVLGDNEQNFIPTKTVTAEFDNLFEQDKATVRNRTIQ